MITMSVLFISKNEPDDTIVSDVLASKISDVMMSDSVKDAFLLFSEKHPDLVIIDFDLPQVNALDLVAKIQMLSPEHPIVLIGKDPSIQMLQKAIDLGIKKYWIKPLIRDQFEDSLLQIAESVIQRKRDKEQQTILLEYKQAFDAATIITKTDKNGKITYANDQFVKISGFEREELIGSSHNIIRHPETPTALFSEMWQTITNKQIWKGRIKNKTKNGGFYIVDATIVPILDSNNDITEFLAIRQDMTRLIELEEKERREEEEQRLLRHQNEVAEEVNKAKESFLLIFTHELKTPLNAIINFSDYLRREIRKTSLPNAEKLTNLAIQIRENGYDMLNTVTTLLDLAKLKSNRIVFQPSAFDLGDMIKTQIERSSSLAENNGIEVKIDSTFGIVKIINDSERMRQIFSNLLSNAFRYGGDKILVSFGQEKDDFWLSVEDNGKGLRNTETIFELFEQNGEDHLTRSSKGTGIGLYFVKTFCDNLGLSISVGVSQKLGGAMFTIRGPILFHPKGEF